MGVEDTEQVYTLGLASGVTAVTVVGRAGRQEIVVVTTPRPPEDTVVFLRRRGFVRQPLAGTVWVKKLHAP